MWAKGGLLILIPSVFLSQFSLFLRTGKTLTPNAIILGGVPGLKEDAMKRTISLALASGLAILVAGCATGTGGGAGGTSAGGAAATSSGGGTQTASAAGIRDFNLQVKCPGIHLEKSKLGWSDDKIMSHENVTPEEIASCEQWSASQPKGYVPPPPPGTPPAKQQAQSGTSAGGAATGNPPTATH
jgi:hypothetical protein